MKNSGMKKQGARIIFGLIALALFTWTAYLTVSFLNMALPASFWIAPYLGLVVFDAGMLGWLAVFLYLAEGATQRAVAIGLTIFNLLGVGLISMSEIILGGQTLTAAPAGLGTAAIWGVGIWTFINVAAIIVYHISSPEARLAAAIQDEKDEVVNMALKNMQARREQNALALSEEMGAGMYNTLVAELMRDADGDGVPDMYERKAERGRQSGPRTVPSDRPELPAFTDDELLRIAAAVAAMSNSTHNAPRQEGPQVIPLATPEPGGQGGNGPSGRKLGGDGGDPSGRNFH